MMGTITTHKPIVLVGMMGTGKSTIGKKLASKLNIQFYDSDKIIEEREGFSVVDIFDYRGEEYFNNKEREVINEILGYGITVISTGGGTFLVDDLRQIIKERAISIWLDSSIDVIHERVARRNTRPQLNVDNQREVIEQMVDERKPLYSEADIHIDCTNLEAHHVVDTVLTRLRNLPPEVAEYKMAVSW